MLYGYMYMRICVCVHARACAYACTRACVCMCARACVRVRARACACVRACDITGKLLMRIEPHTRYGIRGYEFDRTQGPACSLAAGAATAVRNYCVDVCNRSGQTSDNQINNLRDLEEKLGNHSSRFFEVKNGYVDASPQTLSELNALQWDDADQYERWLESVRVGWHRNVAVDFSRRFDLITPEEKKPVVSQVGEEWWARNRLRSRRSGSVLGRIGS